MDKTPFILISLLITIAAIGNLIRFLWNIPVTIGSVDLPGWTGAIIFVAFGLLAAWSFKAIWTIKT